MNSLIFGLSLADGQLQPQWRQEQSVTSGGSVLTKHLGPMLWRGDWVTVKLPRWRALDLETDLMALQGGIHTFEAYDPRRPKPLRDTGGDLDGVEVFDVRADRRALRLSGLPAGFEISKSDYLSISAGGNLHLHRVTSGATAEGDGQSLWIEVAPFLRSAIAVGQAVVLRQPCARFVLDPESVQRQPAGVLHDTISFSGRQFLS